MGIGRIRARRDSRAVKGLFAICLLASPLALKAEQVVVTWQGGTGDWSVPGNWSPALIPNNATDSYLVQIDNVPAINSIVSLDASATVDGINVGVGDVLRINNNQSLTIATDSIVNNGMIMLDQGSGTGLKRIQFNAPVMLHGSGEYVMSGNLGQSRFGPLGGLTTLNPQGTIRGAGWIQMGDHRFVNHGLVRQEGSWWMTIANGAGGFENSGVLEATGSSGLALQGSVFENHAGTMRVLDGSYIELVSGVTIRGGELITLGTGEFRGGGHLEDIVLKGTFAQRFGDTRISGRIENQGTWHVGYHGRSTQLRPSGEATLAGDGELELGGDFGAKIVLFEGDLFTHEEGHTISNIGWNEFQMNGGQMINRGLIETLSNLTINPGSKGTLVNESVIESVAGYLRLTGGTIVNSESGVIRVVGTGSVEIGQNAIVTGGLITSGDAGSIIVTGTLPPYPLVQDIVLEGVVTHRTGQTIRLRGTVTNNTSWTINHTTATGNASIVFEEGAVLTGIGEVFMTGGTLGRIISDGTTAINDIGHTIRGRGQIMANTGGFINRGTVRAEGSSLTLSANVDGFLNEGDLVASADSLLIIANGVRFLNVGNTLVESEGSLTVTTGNYVQMGGETQVNGTMTLTQVGASANINGGILSGTGVISRSVNNSGFVGPGTSAGTLTINQHYNQSASGTLVTELGGLVAGTQHDRLAIQGNATIDGRLHIALIDDFVPTVGNEFTILTAAAVSGEFDALSGALLNGNVVLEPVYLPTEVRLLAVGIEGIAVDDVMVEEGATGTTDAVFTIFLSEANDEQTVEVTVQTEDGTAVAGSDYIALGPTVVSFAPGETEKQVTVQVINDGLAEPEEYFKLVLSNGFNASIARAYGVGIIAESPKINREDWMAVY